jgi:hypothetical protein
MKTLLLVDEEQRGEPQTSIHVVAVTVAASSIRSPSPLSKKTIQSGKDEWSQREAHTKGNSHSMSWSSYSWMHKFAWIHVAVHALASINTIH